MSSKVKRSESPVKSSSRPKGKSKKRQTAIDSIQRRKEASPVSKPVRNKTKNIVLPPVKPVAKIPSSREESSCNWKALLQTQVKQYPDRRPFSKVPSQSSSQHSLKDSGKDSLKSSNSAKSKDSSIKKPNQVPLDTRNLVVKPKMSSNYEIDGYVVGQIGGKQCESGNESNSNSSSPSKDDSQKAKQEFRALGLSESQQGRAKPKSRSRTKGFADAVGKAFIKKPPGPGMNDFGYFDYSHYGVLRTPITSIHEKYMEDTGIIAMDCEMVGVGVMKESALGRVSIVNEYGYCLYDTFVRPKLEITDYRTQFSGIREEDMKHATPFHVAVQKVADLLKHHILVGHSLKNDMSVLFLSHPKAKTRDTAMFFKKHLHCKTPKLKTLVKKILHVDIQEGEHSSITDAQATMALYQMYQREWEEQARQACRGVDVFRQTLEEFHNAKTNSKPMSVPTSPSGSTEWYDSYLSSSDSCFYPENDLMGTVDVIKTVPQADYSATPDPSQNFCRNLEFSNPGNFVPPPADYYSNAPMSYAYPDHVPSPYLQHIPPQQQQNSYSPPLSYTPSPPPPQLPAFTPPMAYGLPFPQAQTHIPTPSIFLLPDSNAPFFVPMYLKNVD